MQPTSPASSERRSGFLLVEVLVALSILALVAAIVFPRLASVTGPARLKASAYQVAGLLRADRVGAMRSGRVVVTAIDLGRRLVASGAGGTAVDLPDDVKFTATYAANERPPGVRFFPNGSASGGLLTLASAGAAFDVRVDWFTGAVTVEGPRAP